VAAETPAGLDFGNAALRTTRHFRIAAVQMAQGAEGELVAVRVGFAPRELPEPVEMFEARSERALVLARQLLSLKADAGQQRAFLEGAFETLAKKSGAPEAYMSAIRVGVDRALERYGDVAAHALAARFSEDQLGRAVAFLKTAEGRALEARAFELGDAMEEAGQVHDELIRLDAAALYCKTQPCAAAPP
jgi:hypothetical protein